MPDGRPTKRSADPLTAHLANMRLRGLADTTMRERAYAVRRLARHLDVEVGELMAVTEDDLDCWQYDIAHLTARYRSSWLAHVSRFYAWAHTERLVRANPAVVLLPPKLPRLVPHPIGEADLHMAVACAPTRVRPMLVLAAYAGLRAGEIARLQRQHVMDTDDPAVVLVEGKGGRERIVPLSSLVLTELRLAGMPSRGYVLSRRDGKAGGLEPHMVSKLCNDYLHGLGINETLHSLRHRMGTVLYRSTRDLRLVQEVLGHSSPAVTAGYAAHSPTAAVAAVEAICQPAPSLVVR